MKKTTIRLRYRFLHFLQYLRLLIMMTVFRSPLTKAIVFGVAALVTSIYIGYWIGSRFMPVRNIAPDRNVLHQSGRINYSLYYTHNLTLTLFGDLGDQMFQYASLYGIAKANGLRPLVASSLLTDVFPHISAPVVNVPGPGQNWPKFREHRSHAFDQRSFTLNYMKNIELVGQFQSWRYFDHIRTDIRREFHLSSSVHRLIQNYLSNSSHGLNPGPTYVGLHLPSSVHGPTNNFYKAISYYYTQHYENVVFIIITDNVQWAKTQFPPATQVACIDLGHPGLNLALLAACNHSVVVQGAMGWWGAWLADGNTIYYRDYPSPGSQIAKEFRRTDYYPPQWVPV